MCLEKWMLLFTGMLNNVPLFTVSLLYLVAFN